MCQSLALIAKQEHDIAGLDLHPSQLEPQTDAIDGVGILTPLQRVPRAAPTEPLICAAPWRAAIGRL
jgi:hypothetical protein